MGRVAWFGFLATCVLVAIAGAQDPPATPAPETFVLEGRVVDLRGEGVPAAKVWVAPWDDWDNALVTTVADGEGLFRLARVTRSATSMYARARAEGFCVGTQIVAGTPASLVIEMQHAATVRGVLRDKAGQPAAGTLVRADPDARTLTYVHVDARSDTEGRFELRDVPLGPIRFTAWLDGQGLFEVVQHVQGDCEAALAPAPVSTTSIEITITDVPENAARVGISLLPYRNGSLTPLPPPHDRPRADGRGKWSLALVPDCDYTVMPSATGYAFAPRQQRLQAGSGPHRLAFCATAIGGTELAWNAIVRGPDDKPVGNVRFVMRAPNGGNRAEATSAADGTMTFKSPLASGAEVVIYSTDARWVVDQQKDASKDFVDRRALSQHEAKVDPKTPLELRVIPACNVRGKVLLADKRPAAFVQVELQESSANRLPQWMAMKSTTTDSHGDFVFTGLHHLADEVRVHVDGRDGSHDGAPLHIAKPDTAVDAGELILTPPATVEGVVFDSQQRPVAGVRVWLRDWNLAANQQRSGAVTEVITDRQGRYRFVGASPGGAYLELIADAGERRTTRACDPFEVEAGKTHTFDLQLSAK